MRIALVSWLIMTKNSHRTAHKIRKMKWTISACFLVFVPSTVFLIVNKKKIVRTINITALIETVDHFACIVTICYQITTSPALSVDT